MLPFIDRLQALPSRYLPRFHWRRLAPAFLFLLVLLYFWPFFLRGEVIAPTDLLLGFTPWSSLAPEDLGIKNHLRSDILDSYLPNLQQMKESIADGDLQLWNPMKAQGRPFASQLNNSFFHPFTLVLITLFPLAEGFSLLVMAKLAAAGLFMYLFLRRFDISRGSSLLGAVAYMFGGFNIVWLMWQHTLVSAFAPLLFLQTENLVRRPSPSNAVLLGFVVAIMLLGGFPAVAAYFFYAVGLYFLVRVAQRQLQGDGWRISLAAGATFGSGFLLGGTITAFLLLPTLEHAAFIDIGYRERLSEASLPLKGSAQLVFPNFYGNQVFGNFRGPANLNESSGYVGIVTLGLALFGGYMSVARRQAIPAFFAALILLVFLIVYDVGPVLGLVRRLPVFDLNPSTRLLSVFVFASATVAAFGLDELRRLRCVGTWRLAVMSLAGLTAAALLGLSAYLGYEIFDRRENLSAFLDNFPTMEFHTFRLVTVALGVFLAAVFAGIVALHVRRPLPAVALTVLVLVLVTGDLLVFAYRQNPTVSRDYFYPQTPAISFLQANQQANERIAPMDGSFMVPGTQLYYGLNSAFSHSLFSERHRKLIEALSPDAFVTPTVPILTARSADLSSAVVDLLGIRFLTVPFGIDLFAVNPALRGKYDLVYEAPDELRIYENREFAPAFLAPGVTVLDDPDLILEQIRDPSFDPNKMAYVEKAPPAWWPGPGSAATEPNVPSISVAEYEPERIVYHIQAPGPALLVTPELYHPGWTASARGESLEVYRANYLFRAVFVDEGDMEVAFSYQPHSFRWGVAITLASLGTAAVVLAFDYLRRRLSRPGI